MFIVRPINQLSGMYSKIIQANAAAKRVFEIIDKKTETKELDVFLKTASGFGGCNTAVIFRGIAD